MITKALKQGLGLVCVLAVLSGCSSTSTQDDAAAQAAADAAAAAAAQDAADAAAQDALANLQTVVYFDFDQSMLGSETRAILIAHAEVLKSTPRSVRLEGHGDERGTREYNMALGERRSNAVRDFLVLQGVDSSLLESISYGEERPAVLGSSENAYEQNRRVEIK